MATRSMHRPKIENPGGTPVTLPEGKRRPAYVEIIMYTAPLSLWGRMGIYIAFAAAEPNGLLRTAADQCGYCYKSAESA